MRVALLLGGLGGMLCGSAPALAGDSAEQMSVELVSSESPAAAGRDAMSRRDRVCVDRGYELMLPSVFDNRWMGILTMQNPADVWITQEIMYEVKPDVVVETGTLRGGSAALWATILAQINPEGRVITIDIRDNVRAAKELPIVKERVQFLVGSSVAPAIVEEVKRQVAGKRVMVILDSNHRKPHVLRELEAYAPLIPVGGYIIVQDSAANGHPVMPEHGPGPYEAIEAFLEKDDRFVADRSRERMVFTLNPMGYLKRVR